MMEAPPTYPKTAAARQRAISRHLKSNKQQLLKRCHFVLQLPPSSRTDKQLQLVVDFTVQNKFFQDKFEHVGDSFHVELCRRIQHRNYKFDERIIRQGEIGDEFYIIIAGSVRVELVKTILGEKQRPRVLVTLGPGDSFGELALLNSEPRAASCIASSLRCELMVIKKHDFVEILQKSHLTTLQNRKAFLRKIPLFRSLTPETLVVVASHMSKRSYGCHQIIIKEGDHAAGMFVLTKGTAKVYKNADNQCIQLNILQKGDIFGELGVVLPGSKRTASVISDSTKTECLELSRTDFFEFISQYQDIMLDECLTRYPTDREIIQQIHDRHSWLKYKRDLVLGGKFNAIRPPISQLRGESGMSAIAKLRKKHRRRSSLLHGADFYDTAAYESRSTFRQERAGTADDDERDDVQDHDDVSVVLPTMKKTVGTVETETDPEEEAEKMLSRELLWRRESRRSSLDIHATADAAAKNAAFTSVLRHSLGRKFSRKLSLKISSKKLLR